MIRPPLTRAVEACREIVGILLIETLDPAADLTTPERLAIAKIAVALDAETSRWASGDTQEGDVATSPIAAARPP